MYVASQRRRVSSYNFASTLLILSSTCKFQFSVIDALLLARENTFIMTFVFFALKFV
ncbi:hypothetical protein J6V86_01605 [bacterium]|nr:hypothetical protein [bacterium]